MDPNLAYEALQHLVEEVVFIHSEDRRIVFVSPSVEQVLGYTPAEFMARNTIEIIHPEDLSEIVRVGMALRAEPGGSYRSTCRVQKADGSHIWCETVGRNLLHTELRGVINTLRDISERRALEEQLFAQAFRDELTGLPNRRAFLQELEQTLKEAPSPMSGLMILDLDGFKAINDRCGHLAGDALLTDAAASMVRATHDADVVARLGGDEFAILCHRVRDRHELQIRAERVCAASVGLRHEGPRVTFSIGATLVRPGDDLSDLLRRADEALYCAKRAGRDRVELAVGAETRG